MAPYGLTHKVPLSEDDCGMAGKSGYAQLVARSSTDTGSQSQRQRLWVLLMQAGIASALLRDTGHFWLLWRS